MSNDTSDLSPTSGSADAASPGAPTPPVSDASQSTSPDPSTRAGGVRLGRTGSLTADDGATRLALDPRAPAASLAARLGAEAIGTFFLVLAGLGAALYTTLSGAATLGIALGFGLALVGGTIAFGHVSGGHFNPAVTIGAAIADRLPWRDVLPYWLAQLIGGALASGTLFLTIPSALPTLVASGTETTTRQFFATTASGFGEHSPLATLSTGQVEFGLLPALLIEIIGTALLVGVVLAATKQGAQRALAPFAVGVTYAALVLLATPISNGSLNPARATAAALFSGGDAFAQLWVFWVAPLVGALLAGLAYRAFASGPLKESEEDFLEEDELVLDEIRA